MVKNSNLTCHKNAPAIVTNFFYYSMRHRSPTAPSSFVSCSMWHCSIITLSLLTQLLCEPLLLNILYDSKMQDVTKLNLNKHKIILLLTGPTLRQGKQAHTLKQA
jgi:hypothetical protein